MENPAPRNDQSAYVGFNYPLGPRYTLAIPDSDATIGFFQTLLTRRSSNVLSPLTAVQLGHLLWYAAKAYQISLHDGYLFSKRASPSAGAIHPIDVIIYRPENDYLEYYNPFEHSSYHLHFETNSVLEFLSHIQIAFPTIDGTVLWFVVHSYRTSAKYDGHESLVWRDAGALLQTVQLTANALGLVSCPVGTLAEPYLSDLFEGRSDILSAGGIIIGNI